MKKLLMIMFGAFLLSTSVFAQQMVSMTFVGDIDDTPLSHQFPKTPLGAPKVYIDDYILLFETNHPEYILNIKDENNNVVYSTVVPSTQTQVILPSTLSGNYEINLVMGNWLFTGWINL